MKVSKPRRKLLSLGRWVSVGVLGVSGLLALGTTSATSAGAAAATKSPIKIGMSIWNLSIIGENEFFPGIRAAVRAINKAGGINGHPLQWVQCNETDPTTAENCAQKMQSDGVVATVEDGVLNDEIDFENLMSKEGIPQIDPFVEFPQSYNNPNAFPLMPGQALNYYAIPPFMKAEKIKDLHLVTNASAVSPQTLSELAKAAKHYKVKETGALTSIPLTAADLSSFVLETQSFNAGVSVLMTAPPDTRLFVQSMLQLHKNFRLATDAVEFTAPQVKEWGGKGGPLDKSLLIDSIPPPATSLKQYPGLKRYQRDVKAEYKAGDPLAAPDQLTALSAHGWLAVQAFAKIAKTIHGTVTAAKVKQALHKAKNVKLFGIIPPWTPSKKGPASFKNLSNPYDYLITVKNGKEVLYQKKPVNIAIPFKK